MLCCFFFKLNDMHIHTSKIDCFYSLFRLANTERVRTHACTIKFLRWLWRWWRKQISTSNPIGAQWKSSNSKYYVLPSVSLPFLHSWNLSAFRLMFVFSHCLPACLLACLLVSFIMGWKMKHIAAVYGDGDKCVLRRCFYNIRSHCGLSHQKYPNSFCFESFFPNSSASTTADHPSSLTLYYFLLCLRWKLEGRKRTRWTHTETVLFKLHISGMKKQ